MKNGPCTRENKVNERAATMTAVALLVFTRILGL